MCKIVHTSGSYRVSVNVQQGRPTRGPRAKSGPPKVLKWPAVGWLIDASALTL